MVAACAAVACALLGLSLAAVVQQSHISSRLAELKSASEQLRQKQDQSLGQIEQAMAQLSTLKTVQDNVQASLQNVTAAEAQLATKVGALEAAEAAARDGLATITSRLDSEESLAASVRQLLAAQETQTASQTAAP